MFFVPKNIFLDFINKNIVIAIVKLANSLYICVGSMSFWAYCRHTEDERQTLGYLILKIWTIFNVSTMQVTGNDAHAEVYISVFKDCHICQRRELLLVIHSGQSRASV